MSIENMMRGLAAVASGSEMTDEQRAQIAATILLRRAFELGQNDFKPNHSYDLTSPFNTVTLRLFTSQFAETKTVAVLEPAPDEACVVKAESAQWQAIAVFFLTPSGALGFSDTADEGVTPSAEATRILEAVKLVFATIKGEG